MLGPLVAVAGRFAGPLDRLPTGSETFTRDRGGLDGEDPVRPAYGLFPNPASSTDTDLPPLPLLFA